jgi:uncharacterized protein
LTSCRSEPNIGAVTRASDSITKLPATARHCPICGRPAAAAAKHQPFCSPRCAQIDLGRWLKGNYRVETEEAPENAQPEDG